MNLTQVFVSRLTQALVSKLTQVFVSDTRNCKLIYISPSYGMIAAESHAIRQGERKEKSYG